MSIEAINWALNHAPIPTDRKDSSSLAIVLVGLANHADSEGRNAFPAVKTLVRYTRLKERTVQYALRELESLDLIRPSDPDIIAAYVRRSDRRPNGWDLAIHTSIQGDEVHTRPDGVQTTTSRGAHNAPEPSFNHPGTFPARERASPPAPPAPGPEAPPPICGQCDARPNDPVTARIVWQDADRKTSTRCPRCHPAALAESRTTAPDERGDC